MFEPFRDLFYLLVVFLKQNKFLEAFPGFAFQVFFENFVFLKGFLFFLGFLSKSISDDLSFWTAWTAFVGCVFGVSFSMFFMVLFTVSFTVLNVTHLVCTVGCYCKTMGKLADLPY